MNTNPGMRQEAAIYILPIVYALRCSRPCSFIVETEFAPANDDTEVPLQTTTMQDLRNDGMENKMED
jgi:hypothetical protein